MGCMFSGKTTELIRRCRKHEITEKKVLKVKFEVDTKNTEGEKTIITHAGLKTGAVAVNKLSELGDKFLEYDVIGIDEG